MLAAGAGLAAAPVQAEPAGAVDIAAGRLGDRVSALAEQTNSSIALADPAIGTLRSRRAAGRLTAEQALRRMLRGLPLELVVIDAANFRIVRARPRPKPPRVARPAPRRRAAARPPQQQPQPPVAEIVVTATKRDAARKHHAGTLLVIDGADLALAGSRGTEALAKTLTSLSSTHLGAGRDKLFLRGVGDSSFSGHSQATVGQYYGEARLNYSGPDPDLRLYDVARTEVLLGPQGTLYGAGSLGGIIRIEPTAPDPEQFEAGAIASGAPVAHGATGGEAAAVVNLPLGGRGGALRLVGYHIRDGGFIDDRARGRADTNRLDIAGARAAIAFSPAEGWHARIDAVGQAIDGRDAGYADRRLGRLARAAPLAQPHSNRFGLLSLTVRREGEGSDAVVNVAHSRARLEDMSDASEPLADSLFLVRREMSDVTSAEARIGRSRATGDGWLVGASLVDSRTSSLSALHYRDLSHIDARADAGMREYTLFGEAARSAGPFLFSAGGRLVRWKGRGLVALEPPARRAAGGAALRGWRLLPAASALLAVGPDLRLYLRFATSYRPPTSVASPGNVNALAGDSFSAIELGARLEPQSGRPFSGAIGLSLGRWRNVQADALDETGYLSAANIGNASIATLEARANWRLARGLELAGGLTLNRASVLSREPTIIIMPEGRLPNVPDVNAQLGIVYASPPAAARPVRLAVKARYVGRSRLGLGPLLGRVQGGFAEVDADAAITLGKARIFMSATNLLESAGNRFALGSIAQPASDDLFVPQVPRTIRFGVRVDFR